MNRFRGMNSASLCSLAGRYDNSIPIRFLTPIDCLKIPALAAWVIPTELSYEEERQASSRPAIVGQYRQHQPYHTRDGILGHRVFCSMLFHPSLVLNILTKKSAKQENSSLCMNSILWYGKMRMENQTRTWVWKRREFMPRKTWVKMTFKNSIFVSTHCRAISPPL